MGGAHGPNLCVVTHHDPGTTHTNPAVSGLHQLSTGRMPAAGKVTIQIFVTAAHI